MKPILLASVITFLAAGSAIAGSVTPASIDPIVVVAPTPQGTDWGGFYLGGGYSSFSGSQTYTNNMNYNMVGSMVGGFAGYNLQSGTMVYGAELAYSVGDVHEEGFESWDFSDMLDIKGRVGFGLGDALIYGVVGWSTATWDPDGVDDTASGINAGAGISYLVTDKVFIGAEYLFRDLQEDAIADFVAPLTSYEVRLGIKF